MSVKCEFAGGPMDGVIQAHPTAAPEIRFPWESVLRLHDDVLRSEEIGEYRYVRRADVGIAAIYDFDPSSAPRQRR